jgi:hypothetical protein
MGRGARSSHPLGARAYTGVILSEAERSEESLRGAYPVNGVHPRGEGDSFGRFLAPLSRSLP